MGKIDLLRASFSGKVGETIGVTLKGQACIKARSSAIRHPSDLQKRNVRAFEKLCRFSGGVTRSFRSFLDLNTEKMLPHNALCKQLAPVIRDKIFDIDQIQFCFPSAPVVEILAISPNLDFTSVTVDLMYFQGWGDAINPRIFVCVLTEDGTIRGSTVTGQPYDTFTFPLYNVQDQPLSAVVIVSDNHTGKYRPISCRSSIAEFLRYSTDEQETGDKWLDGSPIFYRTYILPGNVMTGGLMFGFKIGPFNVIKTETSITASDMTTRPMQNGHQLDPALPKLVTENVTTYFTRDENLQTLLWNSQVKTATAAITAYYTHPTSRKDILTKEL